MKEQEKAIKMISDACEILGWGIAVPEGDKDVAGLIIGELDYIDYILEHLPDENSSHK